MRDKWCCVPVALCVLSLGCGGKKPEAPKATSAAEKPAAVVETPAPVAEAPKGTVITKFRLGSSAGADGVVGAEAHVFGVGEAVFTSFEILNAPQGSKMRVAWALLPDRKPVSRQEVPLSPDKPAVAFKADSKAWPTGDYVLEMSLVEPAGKEDGRPMGSATIKVVKDKSR